MECGENFRTLCDMIPTRFPTVGVSFNNIPPSTSKLPMKAEFASTEALPGSR